MPAYLLERSPGCIQVVSQGGNLGPVISQEGRYPLIVGRKHNFLLGIADVLLELGAVGLKALEGN